MIRTFLAAALSVNAAVSFNLLRRSAENRWGFKGAGVPADCGEVAGFSGSGALTKLDRCHTSAARAWLTDFQGHSAVATDNRSPSICSISRRSTWGRTHKMSDAKCMNHRATRPFKKFKGQRETRICKQEK